MAAGPRAALTAILLTALLAPVGAVRAAQQETPGVSPSPATGAPAPAAQAASHPPAPGELEPADPGAPQPPPADAPPTPDDAAPDDATADDLPPGELPPNLPRTAGQALHVAYAITGKVSYSVDAVGSNNAQMAIQVVKPNAGAKVIRAFLVVAMIPQGGNLPQGGVKINGQSVFWEKVAVGAFNNNYWANVTSLVKPTLDAAAAGTVNFTISEGTTATKIDGEVLAVVWDDPSIANYRTVAFLFGSQNPQGDTFHISFSEPIDPAAAGARADMGLGISWSTGGSQRSLVDVQGQRMTSSAGGYNDGSATNGAYITCGGVGDGTANPPDPYAAGNSAYDDELYTLLPYLTPTTTEVTVYTLNPSNDDNVFFAHFYLSTAAIVAQEVMLTPLAAELFVGQTHTLHAEVRDFYGAVIPNKPVQFTVVGGPHAGLTGTVTTNAAGQAEWSYTGAAPGVDQVQAQITQLNETIDSNVVTVTWTLVTYPPVAEAGGPYSGWVNVPVTLSGAGSTDPDNDIVAYEWDCDNDGQFDDRTGVQTTWTFTQPGTHTVRLRVRDATNQSSIDDAPVTIGNRPPVANPGGPYTGNPGATIQLDGTGSSDPDVGDALTFAWDLDDDGQFDDSTASRPNFAIGNRPPGTVVTVRLRVTDRWGMSDAQATTVTVNNRPPICRAGGPYTATCNGAATTVQVNAGTSSDPDPGETLSYAWTSDCPGVSFDNPASANPTVTLAGACGTSCSVTVTVTDGHGGSSTCSATITVVDTTPPTITTPASPRTVACDGAGNVAELNAWLASHGGAVATDACGAVTWTHNFTTLSDLCGATGAATVTFTARDACNNAATTTATFTISDTTPPTFTNAPASITLETDGAGNTAAIQQWLNSAAATDACGAVTITRTFTGLSDLCGATGVGTAVWTATDACGRQATHSAAVTVVDTTPPTILTPAANQTVQCGGSAQTALNQWLSTRGGATATDLSGPVTWTHNYAGLSDGCGNSGSATVTFTARDACGNTATTAATFAVVDTTPPTLTTAASALSVECGQPGNENAIANWLAAHGGAVATDGCGGVTWTHDYNGVPAECGGAGSVIVTFTATDECGNARTTSAALAIRDLTPPVFTRVPSNVTFPSDGSGNFADIAGWLASAQAVDACGPVTITHNFTGLAGGFGLTGWATVTWTATDACGNSAQCTATVNVIAADGRGQPGVKGSFLIWPNVELKWNAAGQLIQDTFITLSNDYPEYVNVQLYFVQGDPPLPANPQTGERPHPGWNRVDRGLVLTYNQPAYWSAATGDPLSLGSFTVLDAGTPPGRPDPEGTGARVLRGFIVAWAVNEAGHEIRWNHLTGAATIVHYGLRTAWEYPAWAFSVRSVEHGQEPYDCTELDGNGVCHNAAVVPGRLDFDGFQYDAGPDQLLFDFLASGVTIVSRERSATVETDLTLCPLEQDLRQETTGPTRTTLVCMIWNENETSFSDALVCLAQWDQRLLSAYDGHFLPALLQTNAGRARLDAVPNTACPGSRATSLVGVSNRIITFPNGRITMTGDALHQLGKQAASLRYDPTAARSVRSIEPEQEATPGPAR